MKTLSCFISLFLLLSSALFAQVGINSDNSAPDPSAMLDVKSTTHGALLPRMTQAEILAITNPANGLMVFCSSDSKLYIFVTSAGGWKEVAYGSGILTLPFLCGSSITIYHMAGDISPVTKTITYGTITNIPGEVSKCWITSNLGADHQANAVDDATEASAGWYWQFNRKQGFKHTGTTLTPGWAITSIDESSDWMTANDPCTIELGSAWRIPTYTEWYNVDNIGGWTTWTGPWNSGLKLHGSGFLDFSNGSLYNRGLYGYYWSSTQGSSTYGCHLNFDIVSSVVNNNKKAYGFTLRCLREH